MKYFFQIKEFINVTLLYINVIINGKLLTQIKYITYYNQYLKKRIYSVDIN